MPINAWIIAGPTASGKSELAVEVAARVGGEIIGADAFQAYAGLDLLTAKPAPELRARVPHHLCGEIPLSEPFDVAQYLALARQRLGEIRARGRRPIIVGGTGLYVRALLHGLADLPSADPALRAELETRSLPELLTELAALDPAITRTIDLQNRRRVIRALEVCLLTGQPFSASRTQWETPPDGSFAGWVLTRSRDDLHRRIEARVEAMFRDGVIDEVAATDPLGPTSEQVLGYREIREHLAGRLDRAACISAIQAATRQYAKRQITWFKREPVLLPVDAADPGLAETLAAQITR